MDTLKSRIRLIPDFPNVGILFYDITTLLRDPVGFKTALDGMSTPYQGQGISLVIGIESRGFILGAAVADRLGVGFCPVRKPGKLPAKTIKEAFNLEYGSCLLYTSDAADDLLCVDLGGRRIIK